MDDLCGEGPSKKRGRPNGAVMQDVLDWRSLSRPRVSASPTKDNAACEVTDTGPTCALIPGTSSAQGLTKMTMGVLRRRKSKKVFARVVTTQIVMEAGNITTTERHVSELQPRTKLHKPSPEPKLSWLKKEKFYTKN